MFLVRDGLGMRFSFNFLVLNIYHFPAHLMASRESQINTITLSGVLKDEAIRILITA